MIPDIPFPPARMAAVRGAKAYPPHPGRYLESGGLEGEWRLALGVDVRAAAACAPLSIDLLTPDELADFRGLSDPGARRAWLTGRAALRRLRARSGTGIGGVPENRISTGYAEGMAVAAACIEPSGVNLGIELATAGAVPSCLAPFFLTLREAEWIGGRPVSSAGSERLRLLTIKAAMRKADPDGRARLLSGYRLADPAARRGRSDSGDGSRIFRYVYHKISGWSLSLAVSRN